MELEFLGTGAGVPAKHRNVSSIALKLLDERNEIWLFDCGEGTQMQILRTNIRPRKIEKIFITHLHGDHIFGLPGLISSRSFQGGETPLEIYGPKGTEAFVRNVLTISQTKLGYPLVFIDLSEDQAIFEDAHFSVYAKKLSHGIDSYGYRIVEHDHKGELQVDKLKELNIPAGPIYGKLKKGETVQLDNGQLINGRDFVGPDKKGRIVTILGDTRKTTNSVILAKNADVLVHESTFNKNEARMAHNYFHSTTHQAAEVAKEANVQRLLLTHISARYLGKATQELEQEAQEIFPNTKVMKDFEVVDVPFQEEEKS
ncbi:ribonuclease Z [Enterococcus mundtii]|uniref:Ribonuclease Z n=1 Tax=Enterococcus mundtii TaxID=53346 RepID=A0A1V2UB92_ENTMU|nr:ribonuclease Z [Enterococcus mundtii]ONN40368.1 ribonuclease Z [Enterococcus mundtii]